MLPSLALPTPSLLPLLLVLLLLLACYPLPARPAPWSQLRPGGIVPHPTAWHGAASVGGSLFVIGGTHGVNSTFIYSAQTSTWTEGTPLPTNFVAADVETVGGTLFVFGGKSTGFDNQLFTVATTTQDGSFTELPLDGAPEPRNGHSMTHLAGMIFIFGGWNGERYFNDLHVFDTSHHAASTSAAAAAAAQATEVPPPVVPTLDTWLDGIGKKTETKTETETKATELSVPTGRRWVPLIASTGEGGGGGGAPTAPRPAPRNSHTLVAVGGTLLLFGGFSHDIAKGGMYSQCSKAADNCVYYDDLWSMRAPVRIDADAPRLAASGWSKVQSRGAGGAAPVGRFGHAASVIGSSMYLFGGASKPGTVLRDVWVWLEFPLSMGGLWRRLTRDDMPHTRYLHTASAIGGSIYIFGGQVGYWGDTSNDLWRYDPPISVDVEDGEDDDFENGGSEGGSDALASECAPFVRLAVKACREEGAAGTHTAGTLAFVAGTGAAVALVVACVASCVTSMLMRRGGRYGRYRRVAMTEMSSRAARAE